MHCHLLIHEDLGCMTHMTIVNNKENEPWGYCIGKTLPSVVAILISTLSMFFSCLLLSAYTGHLEKILPEKVFKLCPKTEEEAETETETEAETVTEASAVDGKKTTYKYSEYKFCYNKQNYGTIAICIMIVLLIATILTIINDDGYNDKSLIAIFNANEASYYAYLPLYIINFIIVFIATLWLIWLHWGIGMKDSGICGDMMNRVDMQPMMTSKQSQSQSQTVSHAVSVVGSNVGKSKSSVEIVAVTSIGAGAADADADEESSLVATNA